MRTLHLTDDEAGYLLGLASTRRVKKERESLALRQRDGQTDDEFRAFVAESQRRLGFFRDVEDKLILHLADDPGRLRAYQRQRLDALTGIPSTGLTPA